MSNNSCQLSAYEKKQKSETTVKQTVTE